MAQETALSTEFVRPTQARARGEGRQDPMTGHDAVSLRRQILRVLLREHAAGSRKVRDGHALSIEARVEAGDCLANLTLLHDDGDRIMIHAGENLSRFRQGDPATLGEGEDPRVGLRVTVLDYDPVDGKLTLDRDYTSRGEVLLARGPLVLDRREISTIDKLARALERALGERAPSQGLPARLLAGMGSVPVETTALEAPRSEAKAAGLDEWQREAFAQALLADPIHLIQGPPGSGKTHLLGTLIRAFVARGERVLVTAFTHLAINNVLRAFVLPGEAPPCPVFKIGRPAQNLDLRQLQVTVRSRLRRDALPEGPCVIGATVYGAIGLWDTIGFHRTVIDEAAQVPLPHGLIALGSADRATLVGDHQQMGPIVRADPPGELATDSIFSFLHRTNSATLLGRTYRMNSEINAFVSRHFYAGKLEADPSCATRRLSLRPKGRFREILDPDRPAPLVLIEHEGCRQRAPAEAALIADLLLELVTHHEMAPEEIAVIAPYRAQVNAIKQALRVRAAERNHPLTREPVIDTVERIQGQERDVVIASFTNSDPEYLLKDASFFYSPNRLNVLLSRARMKRIIVASPLAFRAIPTDLETLRKASLFRRLHDESDRISWPPR